jgi:hypothetical protein
MKGAFAWFVLYYYITIHGARDIKKIHTSLVNFMSHIARKFSIMHFVTFANSDPHSTTLKEGANHTQIALSLSLTEVNRILSKFP